MEEVRLGTIGSGVIVRSILDNVRRTEGISLAAVYSRSEEKAKKLASDYGCAVTYTDMDAFLVDPNVNTVYIATPNLLHYEQAKKALLANKHVILEKPFTTRRRIISPLTPITAKYITTAKNSTATSSKPATS